MTPPKPSKPFTNDKGAFDHITASRWFQKFPPGWQDEQDDQARSGRTKTVDPKTILKPLWQIGVSGILRVSGEFGISQSRVVYHLDDSEAAKLCFTLPKLFTH